MFYPATVSLLLTVFFATIFFSATMIALRRDSHRKPTWSIITATLFAVVNLALAAHYFALALESFNDRSPRLRQHEPVSPQRPAADGDASTQSALRRRA